MTARLLFSEADDPLGALRWNLAQLRRLLGEREALQGEQVRLRLPRDTFVDVWTVTRGTWLEGARVGGLGRDLLEGMDFASSPAFESWLLSERRHVEASSEAILREAALARRFFSRLLAALDESFNYFGTRYAGLLRWDVAADRNT